MRVEELFAFVAEIEPGRDEEGVIAFLNQSTGQWMPLFGADMARVNAMRPIAKHIATTTGRRVKLMHFTNKTVLEVLQP